MVKFGAMHASIHESERQHLYHISYIFCFVQFPFILVVLQYNIRRSWNAFALKACIGQKKHIRLKWWPVEVWLTECTWVVHNLGEPATNTHRRDFTSNCTTLLGVSSPNSNVLVILCPFLSILSLRNSQFLWHILPFINQWAKIMIVNSLPCG